MAVGQVRAGEPDGCARCAQADRRDMRLHRAIDHE